MRAKESPLHLLCDVANAHLRLRLEFCPHSYTLQSRGKRSEYFNPGIHGSHTSLPCAVSGSLRAFVLSQVVLIVSIQSQIIFT